jgi:hypothetical protein
MHRISRLLILFFLYVLSAKAQTFSNVLVPYSGNFARIVTNQKFSFYKSGAGGNNVAYILAIQPGNALNLYVTAKSSTFSSTDTLNINFFTTGNPSVSACSNGGSYVDGWTAANIQTFINGASVGSGFVSHFTFAVSTTGYATSGILNAAQVCIQVVNNSTGGANDTLDMYASFTPNATGTAGITQVVGNVAAGTQEVHPFSPVLGGCIVANGTDTVGGPLGVQPLICSGSGNQAYSGLLLGRGQSWGFGQTIGFVGYIENDAAVGGGALVTTECLPHTSGCSARGASGGFAAASSAFNTTGGIYDSFTGTVAGTNSHVFGNNTNQGGTGIANACTLEVNVTGAITGTAPVANIWLQDQDAGGGHVADRIAFLQISPGTNLRQISTIVTGSAGVVPYAPTSNALAAGTIINGPIRPPISVSWTTGGTNPSFATVIFTLSCT